MNFSERYQIPKSSQFEIISKTHFARYYCRDLADSRIFDVSLLRLNCPKLFDESRLFSFIIIKVHYNYIIIKNHQLFFLDRIKYHSTCIVQDAISPLKKIYKFLRR